MEGRKGRGDEGTIELEEVRKGGREEGKGKRKGREGRREGREGERKDERSKSVLVLL